MYLLEIIESNDVNHAFVLNHEFDIHYIDHTELIPLTRDAKKLLIIASYIEI
jgi:hypothetical protein